ncbi:MAG: hypothetical protein V1854_00570 [Methanobacteriota archaeon]
MKNKYFGDIRDLFKYDLIECIMRGIYSLHGFTFIPMLTKDEDGKRDGNKRDFDKAKENCRPGTRNKNLMGFLNDNADKRNFIVMEEYFKSVGIRPFIYDGHNDKYFTNDCRDEYFKKIPKKSLDDSLVFVDPDIGLQIKRNSEKHLLRDEVRGLYMRMNENSILMIYQHFPRENHEKYLINRSRELKEKITKNLPPIYISDNEIILFLVTRTSLMRNNLVKIITKYKECYKNYEKLIVEIK